MYRSTIAALLLSALLCGCRSMEPFTVEHSGGFRTVEISGYDPLLPGYHIRSDTLVASGRWFRFETSGESVRVHLLQPAMELLREQCTIEWVDWFRR